MADLKIRINSNDVQFHHLRNFLQTECSTLQLFSLIYLVLLKGIFARHGI
jgi:hypothetical protein